MAQLGNFSPRSLRTCGGFCPLSVTLAECSEEWVANGRVRVMNQFTRTPLGSDSDTDEVGSNADWLVREGSCSRMSVAKG